MARLEELTPDMMIRGILPNNLVKVINVKWYGNDVIDLTYRGDIRRCLIVCPGNLVKQWQDELDRRFGLPFETITNDRVEAARTGNVFQEIPLRRARLDKLSRDESIQDKLKQTDWDLVVCDEAHKMSPVSLEEKSNKKWIFLFFKNL